MRKTARWCSPVALLLLSMWLGGCNFRVIPQDGLAQVRAEIKTIGLIAMPELDSYENLPRSLSPTTRSLLDEFGGVVGRGAYITRGLSKSSKGEAALSEALKPFRPQVMGTLLDRMEQNLVKQGFTVKYVTPPPRKANGLFDLSDAQYQQVDVVVELVMSAGYGPDPRQAFHFPFVRVIETVFDPEGKPLLVHPVNFEDPIATSVPNQITVPGKYALRDEKAVVLDPTLVIEAFRDGATRIADLLAPDF